MSKETIIRHTCDQCGKQVDETNNEWLPCGGSSNWSEWSIQKRGTASHWYGAADGGEFCSFNCAIGWMTKAMPNDDLPAVSSTGLLDALRRAEKTMKERAHANYERYNPLDYDKCLTWVEATMLEVRKEIEEASNDTAQATNDDHGNKQ